MITRLVVQNFLQLRSLDMPLDDELNILVGDNDTGKSTVLRAIEMALSGRYSGRSLESELSPYWFNHAAVADYSERLKQNLKTEPPSILIEIYFKDEPELASLKGKNNSLGKDEPGIRLEIRLNPDFCNHYDAYISSGSVVKSVPIEFYRIDRKDFSGEHVGANRSLVTGIVIDASTLRLQSGTDYYLKRSIEQHLAPEDRAKLALAFRSHREAMIADPAFAAANKSLNASETTLTKKTLELATDVSARSSWDASIVPHLDDSPFDLVGQGEQAAFKLLIALQRGAIDRQVVMVEEPENHLSHANLNVLLRRIRAKLDNQQLIVSTHSSFVLNRLGVDKLKLMTGTAPHFAQIGSLSDETKDYFLKLAGYDTLRLLLARSIILVEGPSDELLVQKAYIQTHDHPPLEDGVDVMSVQLSFKRFLELGQLVNRKIAVITDLDDDVNDSKARKRFEGYENDVTKGFIGNVADGRTLESQIIASAGRDVLNAILGTGFASDQDLFDYMTDAKTEVALQIFKTTDPISLPKHFYDAVNFAK